MGAAHISTQEYLAYNSGSITAYFSIKDCSYNSAQVYKVSTGSFSAIRLETSNHTKPGTQGPFDGANENGYWVNDPDFQLVYSGTLLTASSSPASTMYHMGNLNSRWARLVISVGAGDVFRITWHGKG